MFNSVSCSLTFFTCVTKYLKDKKRNSVYFAREYVRIFVLGYYLLLEALSFRILEQKFEKMTADKYSHLFWRQIGAIVYMALYSVLKFSRGKHCEALSSYCILRIYSATQGYNVVLCCMMMKLAAQGYIGTGKRGIQECVFEETWSLIINGTCLLIMNLSSCHRLSL